MTTIPQWTTAPVDGVADYEVPLPDGLSASDTALETAHARVLAALSAEPDPAALAVSATDGTLRLRYRTDVLDRAAAADRRVPPHGAGRAAPPQPAVRRRTPLPAGGVGGTAPHAPGPQGARADRGAGGRAARRVWPSPPTTGVRWTYAELDARANQVGRALLARGLRPEGVVAVKMERTPRGRPPSSGCSRRAGSTCPSNRTSRPAGSRRCCPARAATWSSPTRAAPSPSRTPAPRARTVRSASASRPTGWRTSTSRPAPPVSPRGDVRARRVPQPRARQTRRPGHRRRAGGRADRAAVLRHLPVAVAVRARRGRPDPARGAETILDVPRFVDAVERGRVNVLQVVPSCWRPCSPNWRHGPVSCPICAACR